MSQISRTLRRGTGAAGEFLSFWCPGCDHAHTVSIGQGGWGFNGDVHAPTFTPSVLVTWPANPNASEEFAEWRTERRCHSFVTAGAIQFLTDSTHSLAGQTVPIPDWPRPEWGGSEPATN